MTAEDNKARVRGLYEEIFNRRGLGAIADYFSPDVVDHAVASGAPAGIEGVRQTITMFLGAFPDLSMALEDLVAEGDRVVARWTMRGTHRGASLGMPPTGKPLSLPGVSVLRIAGGKVVETWVAFDQLGMLRQLGLAPTPVATRKFLALYRAPASAFEQMKKASPEQQKAGMDAWSAWSKKEAASVVNAGALLGSTLRVTKGGTSPTTNDLGGFSILQAESKEALAETLKGHPHFTMLDGSIEVIELIPIPGM
jgi:steroid delta-isomerase-like uncharacterized protein